jgi:hypothetical protein
MKTLELHQMEQIEGGDLTTSEVMGLTCAYAVGIAIVAAGFVTGGLAWLVGGAIAGPTCAAGLAVAATE